MSAPEITPARLRELEKAAQQEAACCADNASYFEAKADYVRRDENRSHARLYGELAAALRAAADQRERLTATLAAREALLRRAAERLVVEADALVPYGFRGHEACALAAEIAAALETEKNDDR